MTLSSQDMSFVCIICCIFLLALDNEPPEFIQDRKITKLQDENLIVELRAFDPEERNFTFIEVFKTHPDIRVHENGTLVWGPTPSDIDLPLIMVEVAIRDECGAEATQSFQLSVNECSCKNGGFVSKLQTYAIWQSVIYHDTCIMYHGKLLLFHFTKQTLN